MLPAAGRSETRQPNIVLIMTDNHGAWTLGCYGNDEIRTPNIDQMASEGMLFTRAFASNPVCSPTRATFLTGLLPSQHGVHCFLRGGRLQVGPEARNTLAEFTSLPEVLKESGYRCGLVGKWHLGDNLHPQEGFDDYWITMPHGGTSTFYGANVIHDGEIYREPKYLTDLWTEHAVRFIESGSQKDEPFFLFLSYNGPYALSRLLLREGQNRHAEYYADKEFSSFPTEPTHPWQFSNRDFINNPISIRRVATEVSGIDDGVGTILSTLDKQGIDDETIVIFVADQGWVGGHGGFWGMGDHTRPVTACDGMMRIPMIWRHPSNIPGQTSTDMMVSNYDLMPTLLNYLGLEQPTDSPGRDFSSTLKGAEQPSWENRVFYEFEGLRSIRTEDWKYVHREPGGPHELFDLRNDPDEQHNLAGWEAHRDQLESLRNELFDFFDRTASPEYDLYRGGTAQTVLFQGLGEDVEDVAAVEPPPSPDDFVVPEFNVPDGYQVDLVAGPPLVEHPLMASFDDRGRLYVAGNAGRNLATEDLEAELPNMIRMLEDQDGDGRFDRSTVFADKMTFPQGVLWHEGALYVASPPNIWRLEDIDDDGVADRREILVDSFGYTGNAASIHGCFLSPDGRIYWCDGRHGHEVRDEAGELVTQGSGSYIFSCQPDGSDVRVHCGGGMDNPVEVDFTESGEVVGTVNILYNRPRQDCLVHWLYGGTYPHSEKVIGEFARTGDLLGPVHKFGHVAVSGMTRYRSGVLDRSFRDDIFVTIFNTGKILRCELSPFGSSFQATEHEFFSCSSRDFHPTDVLEDADGSLLVIDTGGWFRQGCPTSQIARPHIKGGIYRIHRKGMPGFSDPRGVKIAWQDQTASDLNRLLNDTRWSVRDRAIAESARRGDEMVASLAITLQRSDRRPRLNALWALSRIGNKAALTSIRRALADSDPTIRAAACRVVGSARDAGATTALTQLLSDEAPAVRRNAAVALGRIGDSSSVPEIVSAISSTADRSEEHALLYALIEIDAPTELFAELESKDPETTKGILTVLDQLEDNRLSAELVIPFLESEHEELRKIARSLFLDHSDWSSIAIDWMASRIDSNQPIQPYEVETLEAFLGRYIKEQAVSDLVTQMLDARRDDVTLERIALRSLQNGTAVSMNADWEKPLRRLLASSQSQLVRDAILAIGSIESHPFGSTLQEIAADTERSTLVRVAALEASSQDSKTTSDQAFEMLLELLHDESQSDQRLRVAQLLSDARLSRTQQLRLADQLRHVGAIELPILLKRFNNNADSQIGEMLINAVGESKGFWSLQGNDLLRTLQRTTPEIVEKGQPLIEKLDQQRFEKQKQLESFLPLAQKGDAERGRVIFQNKDAQCSVCHRVGTEGGNIGPDLSRIGRIRTGRDLLEAILFPSSSFVREYQPYTVLTLDGKLVNGVIVHETDEAIVIQTTVEKPVTILRSEIDSMAPSAISIMPQGLEKTLKSQELADLIAYLANLN